MVPVVSNVGGAVSDSDVAEQALSITTRASQSGIIWRIMMSLMCTSFVRPRFGKLPGATTVAARESVRMRYGNGQRDT